MQKSLTDLQDALQALLDCRESFAYIRRPDGREHLFNADEIAVDGVPDGKRAFKIRRWDDGHKGFPKTDKDAYLRSLSALIDQFDTDLRKVVISRTSCGRTSLATFAGKVIRYFERFPDALCFFYYTPETGFWLGATPELLLRSDSQGRLSTMALAGTRPVDSVGEWDAKNLAEHAFVVDFIADAFRRAGIEPLVGERTALAYAGIEHLHTPIEGSGTSDCFDRLVDYLSPTPALCGTPRDAARRMIDEVEAHSRGCYGGHIDFTFPGSDVREAYVNLRCARIDEDGNWCAFSGGGIVEGSVPEDEWDESTRKAAPIVDILNSKE